MRVLVIGLSCTLAAACSSSATPSIPVAIDTPAASSAPTNADTASPEPSSTPAATPSPAPSASATALATGVPTSLDPCALITSAEAGQLAGTTFGTGEESTTKGGGRLCVYGANTLNVFTILVGQAPDEATAKAGKAAAGAAIASQAGKGIKFTEVPALADGAAYFVGSLDVSGQKLNASSIYALKGTIFFGFSDLALGKPTPTAEALQAEAQTIIGRLS